jgi:hypothetical protein
MTAIEAEEFIYTEMLNKGYDVYRWQNVPHDKVNKLHIVVKASASAQGRIWDKHTVYVLGYVPDLEKGVADIAGIKAMEAAISEPYMHKDAVKVYSGTTCRFHAEQESRQPETELDCQLVSVMFYVEYKNFKF